MEGPVTMAALSDRHELHVRIDHILGRHPAVEIVRDGP